MDMKTIFTGFRATSHKMYDFHTRAMCAAIAMNMHGLKRFHCLAAERFFCDHLKLANDAGNFMNGDCASGDYPHVPFTQTQKGIQSYMETIIPAMEAFLVDLPMLNNAFFSLAGVSLERTVKMQNCAYDNLAKMRRLNERFKDNNYMPHDVYVADMRLHDKMKDVKYVGE